MKRHGGCLDFVKTLKTESRSNRGKTLEKIQRRNFCTRFHTEVNPGGKPCWHWHGEKDEGDE